MAVSTEERRIVTVLFADMAGSTELGEELDPEEMRGLLARYYAVARETVTEHGGTVEKFIGDAVMAGFWHLYGPWGPPRGGGGSRPPRWAHDPAHGLVPGGAGGQVAAQRPGE